MSLVKTILITVAALVVAFFAVKITLFIWSLVSSLILKLLIVAAIGIPVFLIVRNKIAGRLTN